MNYKKNKAMSQIFHNSQGIADFRAYLQQPQTFVLDLSNASVLEVLDHLADMKEKISPNYRKNLSSLRHNIHLIQELFGCILMPIQVTDIFWHHFVSFLQGRGIALSSIKTMCSQLRTAMAWAARHRAVVSPTFDFVKLPSYNHQQIALTPDDVSRLYHFNIDAIDRRSQYKRHLKVVRDMFVLSCNLGQRFSDMVRIDRHHFDRNIFTILQQKTGVYATVDISRMSIDRTTTYKLLEKYGWKAPITTDISCYDKYVKQLCRYAGMDDKILRETRVNGVIESKTYEKWQLVCSHTARRTFVTTNVIRGYPMYEVMRASGHKTFQAFEKYLCYHD